MSLVSQDRGVLRVVAVSLRVVAPERPMVVRTIGGVTIVGLASAWGSWVGRDGELPAVEAAGVSRELAAHTWRRELQRELPAEEFARVAVAPKLLATLVRQVGPVRTEPEIERWPALAAGEKLLLAGHGLLAWLRDALPLAGDGEAWLGAALALGSDEPDPERWPVDRVGVLIDRGE